MPDFDIEVRMVLGFTTRVRAADPAEAMAAVQSPGYPLPPPPKPGLWRVEGIEVLDRVTPVGCRTTAASEPGEPPQRQAER